MSKGISPTQRTLKALRHQGRICFMVERFNPYAGPHGIRIDGLGFIDLIALDPQRGIVAVQSCGDSFSAHYKKMTETEVAENVLEWIKCGGVIELWSWGKRKRKLESGKWSKMKYWKPRVKEITLEDLK